MTKRTISGQSNFTGTRTEERLVVAKKIASEWWGMWSLLLKQLHFKSVAKRWLGDLPEK